MGRKILLIIGAWCLLIVSVFGFYIYRIYREAYPCSNNKVYYDVYDALDDWEKVCTLDLSGQNIEIAKIDFYTFPQLRILRLRKMGLTSFPMQLTKVRRLVELDLSQNNLGFIPPEIGQLKALRTLNLSYTNIDSLPMELGNIPNLTYVSIANNRFNAEPEALKNFPVKRGFDYMDNPFSAKTYTVR